MPAEGARPASAWQRLAPAPPDGDTQDKDATGILAAIESFLDEPATVAALDQADAARAYPSAVLGRMRELGLAELLVPERATSAHLGALNALLARRNGSLAITVGVNALALMPIYLSGSDQQCRWVAGQLRAGRSAALLLTELDHGSNLLRVESVAHPDPGGYRLVGEKNLINGGREHDLLIALMRTRETPPDRPLAGLRSLSLLLVERTDAVTSLPRWRTLPARSADISGVRFDGAVVPPEALIGREGDGFAQVQRTLSMSHAGIATLASGVTSGALDLALAYARERDIHGRPIITLGAIAEHCARMAALDVVVAALAIKATWLAGHYGPAATYFSAAAKYACCRLAEEAVDEGRRVMGARALLEELPYARFIRDVLLYGVFDGTSHVMLEDLSRYLPRFAKTRSAQPGSAQPGGAAGDDLVSSAYTAAPRTIRAVAGEAHRPFASSLTTRCLDLDDPASARLAALAESLDDAVGNARETGVWDADQAFRFEAAGVAAELEALLAAAELALTDADAVATRYAISWWGDRLAGRLAHLGGRAHRANVPYGWLLG